MSNRDAQYVHMTRQANGRASAVLVDADSLKELTLPEGSLRSIKPFVDKQLFHIASLTMERLLPTSRTVEIAVAGLLQPALFTQGFIERAIGELEGDSGSNRVRLEAVDVEELELLKEGALCLEELRWCVDLDLHQWVRIRRTESYRCEICETGEGPGAEPDSFEPILDALLFA